ncbi:uncharacterized protein DEA37_0012348 [Paragonimus westermani]|uniref:Peptidase M13 N-terminal domain-containing protein n=1 Tax=Paragonimus westermani TaxID=34504 RepID=A0A5J4NQV5_9TREM|nr:uncharacterized protein DEA37_0012348 [Paragonimus westermani]
MNAYQTLYNRGAALHLNQAKWRQLVRIHRPAIDHLTELNVHATIQGLRNIYYTLWTKPSSAKFKVAEFFSSCTNRVYSGTSGMRSFVQQVVNSIGGIWLLDRKATNETGAGDANATQGWPAYMFRRPDIDRGLQLPANWSWMNAIIQLQADLHVGVFIDFELLKRYGSDAQIDMTDSAIQTLSQLAMRARIPYGDIEITERVKLAAKDVQFIATCLYERERTSYKKRKGVSLKDLNERGTAFDWKRFFTTYFNEVEFIFQDEYTVYSNYIGYLKSLSPLFEELQRNYSKPVFHRMLNNYMLWKVLDSFEFHLSDGSTRGLVSQGYGIPDPRMEQDCFVLTHEMFGTVLGAIFVEYHLNEESVNHLKTTYLHVTNIMQAVKYLRSVNNRILGGVADPTETNWLSEDVNMYDAKIGIHILKDELYVPLGAIQPPVYHHTLPSSMNFAGFGSMIGTAIAHLLGELGMQT